MSFIWCDPFTWFQIIWDKDLSVFPHSRTMQSYNMFNVNCLVHLNNKYVCIIQGWLIPVCDVHIESPCGVCLCVCLSVCMYLKCMYVYIQEVYINSCFTVMWRRRFNMLKRASLNTKINCIPLRTTIRILHKKVSFPLVTYLFLAVVWYAGP